MKIFILGATGFIAGDLLYLLNKTHPEYAITCLVRTQENADKVQSKYPDVRCALGSNDSDEVIQSEVEKADLIIHTAISADDIPSITSISTALKQKKTKTFYIHTSGCGMLTYKALPNEERYGKTYDDIEDLEDLQNFPREAIHRDLEEIVIGLAQFNPELIKVAIVSPPGIYGRGRGPINTHAMVIPFFSQMLLKAGHGFISEPLCGWDHVHVHDLSRLFLILAEAAEAGGGKAQWGKEGYYFADAGHIPWKDFMQRLATEAKLAGYIESDELKTYGTDEITKSIGEFASMLNSNEKSRGSRTRKVLGWEPTEAPFLKTVAEGLRIEAEKMGK